MLLVTSTTITMHPGAPPLSGNGTLPWDLTCIPRTPGVHEVTQTPLLSFSGKGTLPWDLTCIPKPPGAHSAPSHPETHLAPSAWTPTALMGMAARKQHTLTQLINTTPDCKAHMVFCGIRVPMSSVIPGWLKVFINYTCGLKQVTVSRDSMQMIP